jgi:hypothetical protein
MMISRNVSSFIVILTEKFPSLSIHPRSLYHNFHPFSLNSPSTNNLINSILELIRLFCFSLSIFRLGRVKLICPFIKFVFLFPLSFRTKKNCRKSCSSILSIVLSDNLLCMMIYTTRLTFQRINKNKYLISHFSFLISHINNDILNMYQH